MPEINTTIAAIIESLRIEPWTPIHVYVGCGHDCFSKDAICVTRFGGIVLNTNPVHVVPVSLFNRIRLSIAYREQRRVQLDAAWRKATTVPADGKEAAAMFEALQVSGEPALRRPSVEELRKAFSSAWGRNP